MKLLSLSYNARQGTVSMGDQQREKVEHNVLEYTSNCIRVLQVLQRKVLNSMYPIFRNVCNGLEQNTKKRKEGKQKLAWKKKKRKKWNARWKRTEDQKKRKKNIGKKNTRKQEEEIQLNRQNSKIDGTNVLNVVAKSWILKRKLTGTLRKIFNYITAKNPEEKH